jgi:hypothetical protein
MKLIVGSASSGKTKRLLELSAANRIPILCESLERVDRLVVKARGYGFNIPMPIIASDLKGDIKEVYIDEIDNLVEKMLQTKIAGLTINKDTEADFEDLDHKK